MNLKPDNPAYREIDSLLRDNGIQGRSPELVAAVAALFFSLGDDR